MKWLKNLFTSRKRRVQNHLEDVVSKLVRNTAFLELKKNERVEFAPLPGCCSPFILTGNSLPVFTYTVFEKAIMEFIQVRVEIARPDQIRFFSTITSTTAPERHGETVTIKDAYVQPFLNLSAYLHSYFPIARKDPKHEALGQTEETIQSQDPGSLPVQGQDSIH